MQRLSTLVSLALLIALYPGQGLVPSATAQSDGPIQAMKLLAPTTGWAATNRKLFWTTDNGANWKDITPKLNHKQQNVSSVKFLDPSTGWVLMHCGDGRDPAIDDVCFEFASTTDGGLSWAIVHPKIVDRIRQTDFTDWTGFSGVTYLDFVDAQHGWAILKLSTHAQSSVGVMLRTVDGGRTWTQLSAKRADGRPAGLPMAGRFLFVTEKDGWIAGGGQPESDLYVTHDGGNAWDQVLLPPPSGVKLSSGPWPTLAAGVWPPAETGVWPSYDLPMFESADRGFLTAVYPNRAVLTEVLFSTHDLGRTWSFERVLPNLAGAATVVDGALVVASTPRSMDKLTLERLPLVGSSPEPRTVTAEIRGIQLRHHNLGSGYDCLEMASDSHGWLLADELLTTSDGGLSWALITPGSHSASGASQPGAKSAPIKKIKSELRPMQEPIGGTGVSMHLGFDSTNVICDAKTPCNTANSLGAMQNWMATSPYYDYDLYLPGSVNRHTDGSVNSAWVSGVQMQGWGLGATWFGLQSSCIINQPQVTHYFGPTVAMASDQGAQEADDAINSAEMTLGFTTPIIYHDIENYTVNSTCSPVVQAFVDAWDTELHLKTDPTHPNGYLAGIYANYQPINSDISTVSTPPDDIWITRANGQVTVWNQGIPDDAAHWPNNQRMHQFLIDQPASFGDVQLPPKASIDPDINDAAIAPGSGVKNYTFHFASFDFPGAEETWIHGINDMNSAGAFINGNNAVGSSSQLGQIAGYYLTGAPAYFGFSYIGGTPATITDPGSPNDTFTYGINNANTIVGDGIVTTPGNTSAYVGFLYPGFAPINYPGASYTSASGLNDAGHIAGTWSNDAIDGIPTGAYIDAGGGIYSSFLGPGGLVPSTAGMNGNA